MDFVNVNIQKDAIFIDKIIIIKIIEYLLYKLHHINITIQIKISRSLIYCVLTFKNNYFEHMHI